MSNESLIRSSQIFECPEGATIRNVQSDKTLSGRDWCIFHSAVSKDMISLGG